MIKKRVCTGLLIAILALISGNKVIATVSYTLPYVIELINNDKETIFVNEQAVETGSSITISCEKRLLHKPLFTIKHAEKLYHVSYTEEKSHNVAINEHPSLIKLDFTTIKFIAHEAKKYSGLDEICLYNDTPYDIVVSYPSKIQDMHDIEQYHRQNGITIEPGKTFHKTAYYTNGVNAKNLRSIGFLILSIAMTENKNFYTISYPRRVYSHNSVVGNNGWKTIILSADTIKWFNQMFSVSCSY
ncbi:hypothetical protein E3J79_01020 [Candidatus Dependentiae bacterium]|nr:MAG: hypothetical protein E3J79_01020 [Candidatus Dependentiae bacterium]